MNRLALGSAQFGSQYGITNNTGQPREEDVRAILSLAWRSGIDTIDTARLYGDSEAVIGRSSGEAEFRIVTKTQRFGQLGNASAVVQELQAAFASSLEALHRQSLYGLLVHHPSDLIGPLGPAIWSGLEELKALGQVQKIGVSVYEAEEIDAILSRYPVEIVQLPFNALDARLVHGGQLQALAAAGVEVHARSIFLQGLLLGETEELPERFAPLRDAIDWLETEFRKNGLTRLEGLLAMTMQRSEIARLVVGVTSEQELSAIVGAAEKAGKAGPLEIANPPVVDTRFLNPSRWSELGTE